MGFTLKDKETKTKKDIENFLRVNNFTLTPSAIYSKFKDYFLNLPGIEEFTSPKNISHALNGMYIGKISSVSISRQSYMTVRLTDSPKSITITEFKNKYIPNVPLFRTLIHLIFGPAAVAILLESRFPDIEIVYMGLGKLVVKVNEKEYSTDYFDAKKFKDLVNEIEQDFKRCNNI